MLGLLILLLRLQLLLPQRLRVLRLRFLRVLLRVLRVLRVLGVLGVLRALLPSRLPPVVLGPCRHRLRGVGKGSLRRTCLLGKSLVVAVAGRRVGVGGRGIGQSRRGW